MRMLMLSLALAGASLAVSSRAAFAQEVTATPLGEYTVRFRHFEGHDFTPGGVTNFVRQRARLGLRFAYGEDIQALVQLQDVRTWGEEGDALGDFSANGLDLHQGYMELAFDSDLRLRIGRQEINYLNQRLIGNANFSEQGRSFDAIRLMARAFDEQLSIDFFYARVLDAPPAGSLAPDDLFAWSFRLQVGDWFQPSLIGVVDLSSGSHRVRATNGLVLQSEWPIGLRLSLEGYLQTGGATIADDVADDSDDVTYFAWMTALHIRFTLDDDDDVQPYFEGFVEALSGDDDPSDDTEKTFDTLFATNHRFYGEADFFLNIPSDTHERGLLDAGAILGVQWSDDAFAQLAFHVFQAMASQGGSGSFGDELDVTLGLKATPNLSFDLNYSLFVPGAAFAGDGDVEHFVYTTASASF